MIRRTGSDHPRSRGVYANAPPEYRAVAGSSPLARGLRGQPLHLRGELGIIPARAGFTALRDSVGDKWSDHPRSRGVYIAAHHRMPRGVGSSPLARGLLHLILNSPSITGIIPARAGFTSPSCSLRSMDWDHPRSRGVYLVGFRFFLVFYGSSPLARGLLLEIRDVDNDLGIIPARAGFTPKDEGSDSRSSDHPRSRGVYGVIGEFNSKYGGSSPLARGLRSTQRVPLLPPRIIPARAGFTPGAVATGAVWGDHPRSRGVYPARMSFVETPAGSSPLARGLRWYTIHLMKVKRIIPARAGFTRRRRSSNGAGPDHPRSRGVYTPSPGG